MNIAIGSDHGGFAVKEQVKVLLRELAEGLDVKIIIFFYISKYGIHHFTRLKIRNSSHIIFF